MDQVNKEELMKLVEKARPYSTNGKLIDYIPALRTENIDDLAISIYFLDGSFYYAGDYLKPFTLQSISKVIALAYVLIEHGEEQVFSKVGMEPTGDPFNSIAKLETNKPNKPLNPMINAGALAVTNLIIGKNLEDKWNRFASFVGKLTKSPISYNQTVSNSEFETAFLNRSLCYFLKQYGYVQGDIEDLLALYTRQCATEMNCKDLARVGAVFSNDGCDPNTGECYIPKNIARICKTFMVTCGMYNASGEFAIKVGIPAKSGVSGGIMGSVPGKCGIGIYGPSLNEIGNSIAGIKLLEMLCEKYDWSIF